MGTTAGDGDDEDNYLQYDDMDDDRPEPELRAFRLLWEALTDWMTPETVKWIKSLHNAVSKDATSSSTTIDNLYSDWTPMDDRSDIGASRCAGVMAMLRLYLAGCMEELNHPLDARRRAEKRLMDILRTFDYSRENPRLPVGHWKAMTCILLDMVMIETRESVLNKIPLSVDSVGVTLEEYQYLTRKAVTTFDANDR